MKIYLAGPWFNDEQMERIQKIEKTLELFSEQGVEVFSPRKETLVLPNASHKDRQKAFEGNIRGIDKCDMILVCADDNDKGTMFEAGYAYATNTPILYYSDTLGTKPFNLMLACSTFLGCVKSTDELKTKISEILAYGILEMRTRGYKYEGEIE